MSLAKGTTALYFSNACQTSKARSRAMFVDTYQWALG